MFVCFLGPEYGTTEAAWKGVLTESDRLCDLHLKVKDNLCNDVMQQVKTWQKDTYHKVSFKSRKKSFDHRFFFSQSLGPFLKNTNNKKKIIII